MEAWFVQLEAGSPKYEGIVSDARAAPLWYKHIPGANGGTAADGKFTITTPPSK